MDERHNNRDLYFKEQYTTLNKYILPLIEKYKKLDANTQVLEIGCGYGGNLVPFIERGCQVTGVDILESSIDEAKKRLKVDETENLTLIASDIYNVEGFSKKFDVIFMKDTLEHIPNHEKFIALIRHFIKEDGVIFQGFPPWRNPFGGHQQMCKSKFLSRLPWFHLLPKPMFKGVLKMFGETEGKISSLLTGVYDTRISLQKFFRIIKENDIEVVEKHLYFINPNYEIKFKLKPRRLWKIFNIPWLRDFYITTSYFILKKK